MNDVQSAELLEDIEIAIAVEQRMLMADAIRRDQKIDGLPDRAAGGAKGPVMPGGIQGDRHIGHVENFERRQLGVNERGFAIVTKSLQQLGQDDRRQTEPALVQLKIEPLGFGIGDAVDEVDEDAGVDDDHRLPGGQIGAHGGEVAFPFHLAAQLAKTRLTARLDQ